MKTIEVTIKLAVKVDDEIADLIENGSDELSCELDLARAQLCRNNKPVDAIFTGHDTTDMEVMS